MIFLQSACVLFVRRFSMFWYENTAIYTLVFENAFSEKITGRPIPLPKSYCAANFWRPPPTIDLKGLALINNRNIEAY